MYQHYNNNGNKIDFICISCKTYLHPLALPNLSFLFLIGFVPYQNLLHSIRCILKHNVYVLISKLLKNSIKKTLNVLTQVMKRSENPNRYFSHVLRPVSQQSHQYQSLGELFLEELAAMSFSKVHSPYCDFHTVRYVRNPTKIVGAKCNSNGKQWVRPNYTLMGKA